MEQNEVLELYKTFAQWLIPPVLAFAIHYLSQISKRLTEIAQSLAVVVSKIDEHDRRISRLEDKVR